MKQGCLLLLLFVFLFQTINAQATHSAKKDTVIYHLAKSVESLKLHDGENLVKVIEKTHSFYVVVEKGKITNYFFKEKDGKKYYPPVTAQNTARIKITRLGFDRYCTICVDVPGWGTLCTEVLCSGYVVAKK